MTRKNKGFTLVELMVVIVIIGVLAALAIPKFTDASTKAKLSEIPTVMGAWDHGVIAALAETGELPTDVSDMVFDEPTGSKWFDYAMTGGGAADAVYTADVATGKSVGPYSAGEGTATSTIDDQGTISHDAGDFADKYLANFVD